MKDFKNLAKKFSALYIGSKECKCLDYINSVFDVVYYIDKQEEAYKVFEKNYIDIVFIDIDGFECISVIEKLKEKVYDLPIAIVTALNDKAMFEKVIASGVTQVIFKPIEKNNLEFIICSIVKKLKNKIDAKNRYYKEQQKIKRSTLAGLSSISDVLTTPLIVFSSEKIIHVNKNMRGLFKEKKVFLSEEPKQKELGGIFENFHDDMCLDQIPCGKSFDIKYYYKAAGIKKVFFPSKYKINLEGHKDSYVVSFTDVAPLLMQLKMMRYQKNKVANYKDLIEQLLVKRLFKDNKKAIIKKEDFVNDSNSIDENLDEKDRNILRRDHSFKIAATEYVKSLDEFLYEDVKELKELEDDMQVLIDVFVDNPDSQHLAKIAKLFNEQSSVIISLVDFIDLGNAVCSLSDFLYSLENEQIKSNLKTIVPMIKNILGDLTQWRENIFVSQNTLDIHYLDASLFSSILQLQVGIANEEETDSGELELF